MTDETDHPASGPYFNPYGVYHGVEPAQPEELEAHAGAPLADGVEPAGEPAVVEALQDVYDPEIPVNIYDLGLIYEIAIKPRGDVDILMTLTAPACPVAGEMPGMVADRVAQVDGIGEVSVKLTWDPPWGMEKMSEDARMALDL